MEAQTVQELLSLQEYDVALVKLKKERRQLESELAEIGERDAKWTAGEAELKRLVRDAELQVRQADKTVQAGRTTVRRLQDRAKGLQQQKAVEAARSEINTAMANLDDAETVYLEGMQAHDRALVRQEEMERQYADERAETEARKAEVEARLAEIDSELSRVEGQRSATAARIDVDVRQEYDRVRGGRTTQALAPVIEGCCGHCFTAIPLQRQAEIRAGRKLVVCEGCGVILHTGN